MENKRQRVAEQNSKVFELSKQKDQVPISQEGDDYRRSTLWGERFRIYLSMLTLKCLPNTQKEVSNSIQMHESGVLQRGLDFKLKF